MSVYYFTVTYFLAYFIKLFQCALKKFTKEIETTIEGHLVGTFFVSSARECPSDQNRITHPLVLLIKKKSYHDFSKNRITHQKKSYHDFSKNRITHPLLLRSDPTSLEEAVEASESLSLELYPLLSPIYGDNVRSLPLPSHSMPHPPPPSQFSGAGIVETLMFLGEIKTLQ